MVGYGNSTAQNKLKLMLFHKNTASAATNDTALQVPFDAQLQSKGMPTQTANGNGDYAEFVVDEDGLYQVDANLWVETQLSDNTTDAGQFKLYIKASNSSIYGTDNVLFPVVQPAKSAFRATNDAGATAATIGGERCLQCHGAIYLRAGETIEIMFLGSGLAGNVNVGSATAGEQSFVSIAKIAPY